MIGHVVLAAAAVSGGSISNNDPFIQQINERVVYTINNAHEVPGVDKGTFDGMKASVLGRWNLLVNTGEIVLEDTDKKVRPDFVSIQGIVEQVLAQELCKRNISSLVGIIHTPAPATPLCTKGNVSEDLVDASIMNDPQRAHTVSMRAAILRSYLHLGGDLYVVYPKDYNVKSVRTEEQLKIYQECKDVYPTHLFDCPAIIESVPEDLVGATYLFKREGKVYGFAIKMTQAKDPKNPDMLGNFGLWFGEVSKTPALEKRIEAVRAGVLIHSTVNIPM